MKEFHNCKVMKKVRSYVLLALRYRSQCVSCVMQALHERLLNAIDALAARLGERKTAPFVWLSVLITYSNVFQTHGER